MTDVDGIDHAEDLRKKMREAVANATMSSAVRNRKLVLWAVRQVLLCALAWYFWDKPWMRWVFGFGAVLALINLAMIIFLPRFLEAKQRRAEAAIDRMARTIEEERPDRG